MNPTLIWIACVAVSWLTSSGPVAGYHVDLGGDLTDVAEENVIACVPETYAAPMVVIVQAFDADGNVGEWSDPLELVGVASFDGNGDGVVSVIDLALFLAAWGACPGMACDNFDADGNGTIGFADFGFFVQSFGYEYRPSGLVVVP